MGKRYRAKSILTLSGFDDVLDQLQRAGKSIDNEGRKMFERCAEITYDALYEQAVKAGLDNDLVEQIDEEFIEEPRANIWSYSVGWKKKKPNANPLPDTYKVLFYNYGTVKRQTKGGANRGAVKPRRFIKKAKLSAYRKCKKEQENFLANVLGEIKGNEK